MPRTTPRPPPVAFGVSGVSRIEVIAPSCPFQRNQKRECYTSRAGESTASGTPCRSESSSFDVLIEEEMPYTSGSGSYRWY
jgi:hypothetical protein